MNGSDVVEHIERCEYCQGLEDGNNSTFQTEQSRADEQILHASGG